MAAEDFSVREIGSLRPRLRENLRFSVQEQGGRRCCVIEDPQASRFYRVGLAEYRFLRALDGTRPVAGILAQIAREGDEAFTENEALHIIRWLKDQHLLEVESSRGGPTDREHRERMMSQAVSWLNPLVCKIPLFRPDRFFTFVEPFLRPLLGWWAFAFWLVVVAAGVTVVGMDWHRFTADADRFFARDNWLWLFVAWTGLKVAHEFSHGIFCKHFGAPVREAGVILVLFVPMGYIDATASLGIPSRWRRMAIAAAGLYMEFFLAAIFAIVWAQTGPGALNTLAHNVVIIGTVVTLFFNANPLMRFDGYYLLSELLDVPNLATRGRSWFQRAALWLLTGGADGRTLRLTSRESWLAAIYGGLSWAWQVLVLSGLLVAASAALRGGGLLLAVIAGGTWIALPLARFGESVVARLRSGTGRAGTLAWRCLAILALTAAVVHAPWHPRVTSEGVVELADTEVLRAECPGFILREHVRDGETVAAGQLLVELGNDEAAAELAQRRIALARQELRARVAYARDQVAVFQAENASIEALRKEIAEREAFLATLQVRAPFAGRVTGRQLGRRHGVFVSPGEEILRLGRSEEHEVKLAISERDEPHFRPAIGEAVQVRIGARELTLSGRLRRVEARATRQPAHPALTALYGGPLALRRTDENAADRSSSQSYELAEPHFNATVQLSTPADLSIGEIAHVRFRSARSATLWSTLEEAFERWLRHRGKNLAG